MHLRSRLELGVGISKDEDNSLLNAGQTYTRKTTDGVLTFKSPALKRTAAVLASTIVQC